MKRDQTGKPHLEKAQLPRRKRAAAERELQLFRRGEVGLEVKRVLTEEHAPREVPKESLDGLKQQLWSIVHDPAQKTSDRLIAGRQLREIEGYDSLPQVDVRKMTTAELVRHLFNFRQLLSEFAVDLREARRQDLIEEVAQSIYDDWREGRDISPHMDSLEFLLKNKVLSKCTSP